MAQDEIVAQGEGMVCSRSRSDMHHSLRFPSLQCLCTFYLFLVRSKFVCFVSNECAPSDVHKVQSNKQSLQAFVSIVLLLILITVAFTLEST